MGNRKRPLPKVKEITEVDDVDDLQNIEDLKISEHTESEEDSSENDEDSTVNESDSSEDEEVDNEGGESDSTVYSEDLEWEDSDEEADQKQSDDEAESDDPPPKSEELGESVEKDGGEAKPLPKTKKPPEGEEYVNESDSSDEEDIRNTIGNVPVNWYDDYEHIGYDWDGEKILKPDHGDQLDNFLKKMEDPDFWRTVRDPQTGQDVVLSDEDVDLIRKLGSQKTPDSDFNPYSPWIDWFTSEVMKMPLRKFPEHKRSFVPSRPEMKRVSKYVHALKMGWMKTKRAMAAKKKRDAKEKLRFYMLWSADDVAEEMRRIHNHIPAPKRRLPDHSESYNPPEEYLMNDAELKKWNRERKSLGDKKLHFVPQKYDCLRHVPSYKRYIRERFLRCLDLYMCPRAIKMKLTIEPEDLVPQLPSPMDLQPFPTSVSVTYSGHSDIVRSISIDPLGQYLASGSDDQTIKLWEVSTGRCLKTINVGGIVRCVSWNPSPKLPLLLVAVDSKVLIFNTQLGDSEAGAEVDVLLDSPPPLDKKTPERVSDAVSWEYVSDDPLSQDGLRIKLKHFKEVRQVSWHGKGDYFFTLMPDGLNRSVLIHQLSRGRSQLPFSKSRGLVQVALFHPVKPFFFVATQRHVRMYDLVKQEMTKKLISGSRWISSLAIHPGGDNLLVGTYDRKVLWFDLELSTRPYKTLSLHSKAVRGVAFHKRYPLFASTSDDSSLIVSHGMVYNDLLKNALIVPLKRFSAHKPINDFSLFDVQFHPYQPWVFTTGADGNIILYS